MSLNENERRRHLRSRPSADGLDAMARSIGRGLRVERFRRLGGGLGSATSVVDLRARSGAGRKVVLKRYPEGDGTVGPEWERLTFARAVGVVPSPEPLAMDEAGRWFGTPAIVMSLMPGGPLLRPKDPAAWMREIAAALVSIQSVDVSRASGALVRPHGVETWTRPETRAWGTVYERAADAVDKAFSSRTSERVLCHGDFHPGNMLFRDGRLSGVIDWSGTRVGPRDFELSYCRTEIALLFGGDAPERLRAAYEFAAGRRAHGLPLWDLMCALGARQWSHLWLVAYREQGRRDLTLRRFRERLRAFTSRALAEM